jgi:hypothetical protein
LKSLTQTPDKSGAFIPSRERRWDGCAESSSKGNRAAYRFANEAVQIATNMQDEELLAATKYTRGCAHLEWGLFGTIQQGQLDLDWSKIRKAMSDFQSIIKQAEAQPGVLHAKLLSRKRQSLALPRNWCCSLALPGVGICLLRENHYS